MWFVGAALVLVAVSSEAQNRTQGSGIRVVKDQTAPGVSTTPSSMTTNVVSGGDVTVVTPFNLSVYANAMNEKNITAHMAAGDSLEIQLAQLAQDKAVNNSVRDYAGTLVADHTAHLAKTIEIITDEDVGAQPFLNDVEVLRMRQTLTQLRNMPPGSNWDAAFLRFQVAHHQNEIDLLNANIKNAHDDDLEEHIEASLKSLAKHRDLARSVATMLGFTVQ
jgi:predicted outer membrane protein